MKRRVFCVSFIDKLEDGSINIGYKCIEVTAPWYARKSKMLFSVREFTLGSPGRVILSVSEVAYDPQ